MPRTALATCLLAAVLSLAGCGSRTATDPTDRTGPSGPTGPTSQTGQTGQTGPAGAADVRIVGIAHDVGSRWTPGLHRRVAAIERRHPAGAGRELVALVVHVGCFSARRQDVQVATGPDGGVVLSVDFPQEATIDCVTALVSVAVVDVPAGTRVSASGT